MPNYNTDESIRNDRLSCKECGGFQETCTCDPELENTKHKKTEISEWCLGHKKGYEAGIRECVELLRNEEDKRMDYPDGFALLIEEKLLKGKENEEA